MTRKELVLREAVLSDAPALGRVQAQAAGAPQWSEGLWRQLLAASEAVVARAVFVAEMERLVCGFIVVSCVGGEGEVESVAVDPSTRRQGIARALCAEAIAWAHARSAEMLRLEVRASNAAALGLYESLGFEVTGRRERYYRAPEEDALLLLLPLKGEAQAG